MQNKQTEKKQNNSNLVKETVKLPKPLLNELEKLLKEKDISRDELLIDAISQYLKNNHNN
jgi:metal-responsive CopG/Arc/MetJ family transcriptional regulator